MRALNSLEDVLVAWRADELDDRMVIRLPTFGGGEPSSGTSGVWSWDATRLLVGTCATDARIVNRAAYEMGRMKSPAKTRAARANGKLGGRPRQGSLPALLDAAEENVRLRAALAGVQKLWADLTSQELYGVEWLEQIDSQDVKEIHIAENYVVAALALDTQPPESA